jgi:hypothetical protein
MRNTEIPEFSAESGVRETINFPENDLIVKTRIIGELSPDWRKRLTMSAERIEELEEQWFSILAARDVIVILLADRNGF